MNPILKRIYETGKKKHDNPSQKDKRKFEKLLNIPVPEGINSEYDIKYDIGDGKSLMSEVFMPKISEENLLPVIVMIHGGGLLVGNRRLNLSFRLMMAKQGYLVFSIEYRHLDDTDFFGAVSDVCCGLKFVRDSLQRYNGDPNRIYVACESAGALLGLYATAMTCSKELRDVIGVDCPDMKIDGLILSSGMLYTTRPDYISAVYKNDLYGKRAKDKKFMKYMNPENPEVMDSLPKVCLASGYGDFLRKNTLRYAKALKNAGHPSLLLDYNNGKKLPHAFMTLFPMLEESRDAIMRMREYYEGPCGSGLGSAP